jgi:hypothetical protein
MKPDKTLRVMATIYSRPIKKDKQPRVSLVIEWPATEPFLRVRNHCNRPPHPCFLRLILCGTACEMDLTIDCPARLSLLLNSSVSFLVAI